MADNFRQCQGYSGFALCTLPEADAVDWSRHSFGIARQSVSFQEKIYPDCRRV